MKRLHTLCVLFCLTVSVAQAQSLPTGELGPMPEITDVAGFKAGIKAARAKADTGAGIKFCVEQEAATMRIFLDPVSRATYMYPTSDGRETLPEFGLTNTLKEIEITREMAQEFSKRGVSGKFRNRGVVLDFVSKDQGQILHTAIIMAYSVDGKNTAVAIADPIHYTFFVGSTKACAQN